MRVGVSEWRRRKVARRREDRASRGGREEECEGEEALAMDM